MFQFWRFTNQTMRYEVGLTAANLSLTRNCLAFVGDGNAHTGFQPVTGSMVAARRNTGHEVRLTLLVILRLVTRVPR
jgi:hypothetical protein